MFPGAVARPPPGAPHLRDPDEDWARPERTASMEEDHTYHREHNGITQMGPIGLERSYQSPGLCTWAMPHPAEVPVPVWCAPNGSAPVMRPRELGGFVREKWVGLIARSNANGPPWTHPERVIGVICPQGYI